MKHCSHRPLKQSWKRIGAVPIGRWVWRNAAHLGALYSEILKIVRLSAREPEVVLVNDWCMLFAALAFAMLLKVVREIGR